MQSSIKEVLGRFRTIRATPCEGDYYGDDDLLRCGKCGDLREGRYDLREVLRDGYDGPDPVIILPVECKHRQRSSERRALDRERERRIRENASRCYDVPGLGDLTLAQDDGRCPIASDTCRSYLAAFEDARSAGTGLLLHGPGGRGKTWCAACVANALLSWGKRVRFTSLSAQIGRIARDHGSADAAIADLVRCDLVVLDDLGTERSTSVAEEGAYNVVNALYVARVPMVVTTNRSYAEMAASGDRVDRRIVERCQPVGF